ncbi:MAG: acyl carrier protein [Phycisphaerae bacterium]|nr:acyl carrier protein [Phycisphaerae bacterium]
MAGGPIRSRTPRRRITPLGGATRRGYILQSWRPVGSGRIVVETAVRVIANPNGVQPVTEQEIEAKVIEIVAKQMATDKTQITRSTNFVTDLNADSLDTVELVMEFEDEFDTSIPDEKAEQIQTVGQAIDFIKQAQGG